MIFFGIALDAILKGYKVDGFNLDHIHAVLTALSKSIIVSQATMEEYDTLYLETQRMFQISIDAFGGKRSARENYEQESAIILPAFLAVLSEIAIDVMKQTKAKYNYPTFTTICRKKALINFMYA